MLPRILGAVGRSLITAGVLILLFVAYELWGTGLQEAKAQKGLKSEFAEKQQDFERTSTTATTTTTTVPQGSVTTTSSGTSFRPVELVKADIPLPKDGEPIGIIELPKIGITRTIVEGVSLSQLKRGPGHYPLTPLPGQAGNAAIAGHRTTYGQPFHNLDKLGKGDKIIVTTLQGKFAYRVDRIQIVGPRDNEVLLSEKRPDGKLENRLTLTACHPKYSAAKRLIVSGILIGEPVAEYEGQAEAREQTLEDMKQGGDDGENSATIGLDVSGEPASNTPAILWGLAAALVWFVTWLAQTAMRRRARRLAAEDPEGHGHPTRQQRILTWTPYLVGFPVFMVVLYVFFENFGRLLPGNY